MSGRAACVGWLLAGRQVVMPAAVLSSMLRCCSAGILLNNQMDDFSTPGQPNVYGIAPSKANFIR